MVLKKGKKIVVLHRYVFYWTSVCIKTNAEMAYTFQGALACF